jgi:hypothetical protein
MAKKLIKKNTYKNITAVNFTQKLSFLTPVIFLGYDKTDEIRDFVLNQNLDRFYDTHPDEKRIYYHVEKAVAVNEYLEDWYITPTNTINIINYPISIRFTIGQKFQDFPNDIELRDRFLKQKLGSNYHIHNVNKIETGEEWHLKSDDIVNDSEANKYKININGYPDTFSFFVTKKFKPFDNEDVEADDDGRSAILIIKMYELKAYSNGHAYEDFVIEQVIDIEGGEEWILGS